MPAPVYFAAGRAALNVKTVRAMGYGYAVNGGVATQHTGRGPSGTDGVYFTASGGAIDASACAFEAVPGDERVWLGLRDECTPEDLARAEQIDGHLVTLGDGRKWLVPVARMLSGESGLPRRLEYTAEGWAAGGIVPHLKNLWDDACRFWAALVQQLGDAPDGVEAVSVQFTGAEEADLAAAALAINYRLAPAEISRLGLFTTETKAAICLALVDFPALKRISGDAPPN